MRRVMLIEDEELILQGVYNIIDWTALSMEVVALKHNGKEALEFLEKEQVDIIVTDINMPVMDGLSFLKELRNSDTRTRCILLTGYDEFDYAQKAIRLDVEDYILKPINEDKLEQVLIRADAKLTQKDKSKTANMEEEVAWSRFLSGTLSKEEACVYTEVLPQMTAGILVYPALMKISTESLKGTGITEVLSQLQKQENTLRVIYLSSDTLFLLYYAKKAEEKKVYVDYSNLQNELESKTGVLTFLTVGSSIADYANLPVVYEEVRKLQKYQVIEGYGSCISSMQIKNRKSKDIDIDDNMLRKYIFKKDKEAVLNYIEDLFINNIKKDASIEDIYRMSLGIAMMLQDIKAEYGLKEKQNMKDLTEMVERIYQAEDLFALKTIFLTEMLEVISSLSEDDSQYTPVIKQIMAEVMEHYQEDMNLKTLSYKYHMNASYLGQIFQKEVGCSFAQYLSNTKNSIAKDLILNTNMKINDIAKKVGYPDTSYFYRKFKQCFGVSPASLREMKKY